MFAADCCGRLRNKRQEAERLEATTKSIKATESINVRWKTDTNVQKTNESRKPNELPRARVSDSDSDSENSPLPPEGEGGEFEFRLKAVASEIYNRHPLPRRDLGMKGITDRLRTICKKAGYSLTRPSSQLAKLGLLEDINDSHAAHCNSAQWQEIGDESGKGQYAKGLENWLAPTMRRWEVLPEAPNGSPKVKMRDGTPVAVRTPEEIAEMKLQMFADMERRNSEVRKSS
jgi:hypothetical protein